MQTESERSSVSRANEGKIEHRGVGKSKRMRNAHNYLVRRFCNRAGLSRETGVDEVHIHSTGSYQMDCRFVIRDSVSPESRPPHSRPEAANSETRMTLGVPMPYIVHNEGKVSYIVQIICDLFRWSY